MGIKKDQVAGLPGVGGTAPAYPPALANVHQTQPSGGFGNVICPGPPAGFVVGQIVAATVMGQVT